MKSAGKSSPEGRISCARRLAGTDLEQPEALARLRERAVKPQTKMRFMSEDEFSAHLERDHAAAQKAGRVAPSGTDPLALQPVD